jgi:hypothetical protein
MYLARARRFVLPSKNLAGELQLYAQRVSWRGQVMVPSRPKDQGGAGEHVHSPPRGPVLVQDDLRAGQPAGERADLPAGKPKPRNRTLG